MPENKMGGKKRVRQRREETVRQRTYRLRDLRNTSCILRTEKLGDGGEYTSGSFSEQDRCEHTTGQLVERKKGEDLGVEQMVTDNLGT